MSQYTESIQKFFSIFSIKLCFKKLLETNSAKIETLRITFDTEQFQMIMDSLEEVRNGKIISFHEAFADL